MSKQVSVKGGGFASSGVASPGDKVTWKVSPILSSAAVAEDVLKQPVYVEDCLPAGIVFDSASVNPAIAQPAPAPAGFEIKCGSGTYLRFNLGERKPNAAIEPIEINTHVSAVAGSGTYRNTVVTQTDPLDPSPVDQRTAAAQITVSQIAGIKLEKQALTPVVQVNPEGSQQKQRNVWQLDFINLNAPNAVSEADVIDVLPTKTGVNGSKFAGTMSFEKVDLLAGDNVTILYTKADKVESSPTAASNGDSGIAWCSAPAGGTVVKGTGACPSSAAEVTGLRFTRPGVFGNQDQISAKITMVAEGNKDGDLYVNRTEARASGLMFNVGPVDSRELANAASLGDKVWVDANGNGQQDSGEKPLAKFPIKLTGTDDLGNQVSLNTETNKDGEYSFAGLRSGTYTVTFDPAGLKTGMAFTAKQAVGDTAADSDGDPASGATDPIVLGVAQKRTDIDQGVTYNTARIGDTVWLDKNGNGLQDSGEEGVDGFKVKLTGTDIFGETVELETTTANGGKYGFEGLVPGNYRVTFDPTSLPAGHSFVAKGDGQNSDKDSDGDPTTGETAAFDLASGQVINNIDQGIAANPGSIGDYVWLDKNFDGVQNDTDEPLANIRVILTGTDDYGNQVQKETKTSDQGRYLFDGLLPGKYVVTFDKSTLPDGHELVAKGQGDNAETDSDADPQTGKTTELTLAAGAQLLGIDQGVSVKRGEVGDLFWNDENYNGVYDEGVDFGVRANGEIKLIGVDVYGNQVELTTNTDGVGKYLFTNVVPGKYRVQFPDYSSHPQSYMVAKGVGDNPRVDSDADPKNGLTDEFTLAPGEKNHTIDAGVADKRGSIGDRVWVDVNENGLQDDGEPGVEGVKVKLRGVVNRTSEVVELETETNDQGIYLFKDLREGIYSVTFDKTTLPAGYDPVEKQIGGDGAIDSDADPQTGKTAEVHLSFGDENLTLDMGIKVRKATVGDFVWFDKNLNGVQDKGEDPVPNFKVTLTGTDIYGRDVAVETTTRDDGKYLFSGVTPGNYQVAFDPASIPAGYRFAPKHQGDDRDADSDGDPATGVTTKFTLAPEQNYLRVDQGLQLLLSSIGDRVWIDKNYNGVQDTGEEPAAKVRVMLTGTDVYGNAVTRETETDTNGNYLFAGVAPGKYVVTFDRSTLPAGYELVAPGRGDDRAKDSDGDAETGATPEFELAAGEAKTDIDQGIQLQLGSVGNKIWDDANYDGVQGDDEKPVAGVKVKLTGTDVYGNKVEAETTTDEKGNYEIDGLVPGKYVVTFDKTTLPAGYEFVPAGVGDDREKDSDGDPLTGKTTEFEIIAGQSRTDIDQGVRLRLGEIGDRVWLDTNGNGVQDEGEKPVSDFKVALTGTDVYGNQVERETKTNENGEYLFDGVVPGKYVVTFDPAGLPAGHRFVAQGAGDDREKDSDGDAQTGATVEITLEPGAEIRSIDQGIEAIPADPTFPVDPAKPTDPAKPGEPAKPVDPVKPGDQPKQRLVVTGGADPLLLAAVLLVGAKLQRRRAS